MENDNKDKSKNPPVPTGGMYRGLDVPVKLLDAIIAAGIAVLGILIFI